MRRAAAALLAALCVGVGASGNHADLLAVRTLRDSLAARYPGVAFELSEARYDPDTRCYVVPFRARDVDAQLTAFVRGSGVVDDYEDIALHDLDLSLELSAQCENLAKQVLADNVAIVDELIATLDVPRGKYPWDQQYDPALVDEPVSFRILRLNWADDDPAAFSRWCDEVYRTLQLAGFPIAGVRFQAYAEADFVDHMPVLEMER